MQRFLLVGFCILSGLSLSAQRIVVDQGFGLAGTVSHVSGTARIRTDTSVIDSDYKLRLNQFGIVYSARMDLIGGKMFSISIASPVMVGASVSGKYSSVDFNGTKRDTIQGGVNGVDFAFEVPLVADFNVGLRSAQDPSNRSFGFYVGGGYVYSYTRIKIAAGKLPYDGFDPVVRAGIRMGNIWEKRWSIGLNIKGKPGANSIRTYGLHILKEL